MQLLSWINVSCFPIPFTDKELLTNYHKQTACPDVFKKLLFSFNTDLFGKFFPKKTVRSIE